MKTLIVGVGSTIRGDDGVGVIAAQRLKQEISSPDIDVLEMGTGGLALLDMVQGYHRLIVLDAMMTGAVPGTVIVLSQDQIICTAHLGAGHEADLLTTLALGKKLLGDNLPKQVFVVAMEVKDIHSFSESLTPEVQGAIDEMIHKTIGLLQQQE